MSENLDWKNLEGLEEPTPTSPSRTRSFTEKLFPSKEADPWDELEGVPEEGITTKGKAKEKTIETLKAPVRMAATGVATVVPAMYKGLGGLINWISSAGVKGEPGDILKGRGTKILSAVGDYIQRFGKENEVFLKGEIEKFLGKPYTSLEKALTGWEERSANIYGQFPIPTMIIPSIVGGFAGQVGEELGLSEENQNILEFAGMLGRDVGRSMINLFKNKNMGAKIVNFLKKNPKATGKLTGLSGTQLEIFNSLSEAEQAKFITNIAEKEIAIRSGVAVEEKAAQIGGKILGEEVAVAKKGVPLEKRKIAVGGEDLGLKPPSLKVSGKESQIEGVLGKVHPTEIGNKRIAGQSLKKTIMETDRARYKAVSDLYDVSRKLNKGIEGVHPNLVAKLNARIKEIKKVPSLSAAQKEIVKSGEELVKRLSDSFKGRIIQYRSINNQVLIDQIKNFREKLDYDFAHGASKNIFKPMIKDIQEGIVEAANAAKNPKAVEALNKANREYRKWATEFNNDYINPYRDRTNFDYETLINKNLDPDNFNVIRDVVGDTKVGKEILEATKREIVEKKLAKFMKEPALVRSRDFRRAMTDLESVLTPKEVGAVKKEMESLVPKKLQVKVKRVRPSAEVKKELEAATKEIKATAKYSDKSVSEIRKLAKTPEGIQQIKKDLSRTKNGKQLFDKFAKQKIDSILSGGKIKPNYTGDDLFKVLNKEENYALIESLTSPKEASIALDAAEKLANRKFTKANVKKIVRLYGKYKILHFLVF